MFDHLYHPNTMHASVPHEALNYGKCNICGGELLIDSSGDRVCIKSFCRQMRMNAQNGRHDLFLVLLFGEAVKDTEMYRAACERLNFGRGCAVQ